MEMHQYYAVCSQLLCNIFRQIVLERFQGSLKHKCNAIHPFIHSVKFEFQVKQLIKLPIVIVKRNNLVTFE